MKFSAYALRGLAPMALLSLLTAPAFAVAAPAPLPLAGAGLLPLAVGAIVSATIYLRKSRTNSRK